MTAEMNISSHALPQKLDPIQIITLLEWIHLAGQIEREDELKSYLDGLHRQLPIEYMVLILGRLNPQQQLHKLEKVISVNFPSNWVKHYIKENYATCDPILQSPLDNMPIRWNERFSRAKTSLEKRFVAEASAIGLGNGISFTATSRKHNLACMASITGEGVLNDTPILGMLNALTPHLQQVMLRVTSLSPVSPAAILLSTREHDIFGWMSHGKTNWEIATILNISERTVKFHVANIIRKLNANNRTHAIVLGLQQGIQQPLAANG